jgi:hypothetical protein
MDPKKAPAWNSDTTFACIVLFCEAPIVERPNSSWKDSSETVVPMKDVVYPIMQDAKDAVIADTYTRQLYTLFGVGRSSTMVRIPIFAISNQQQKFVSSTGWRG